VLCFRKEHPCFGPGAHKGRPYGIPYYFRYFRRDGSCTHPLVLGRAPTRDAHTESPIISGIFVGVGLVPTREPKPQQSLFLWHFSLFVLGHPRWLGRAPTRDAPTESPIISGVFVEVGLVPTREPKPQQPSYSMDIQSLEARPC
jgi:hypothetical protein